MCPPIQDTRLPTRVIDLGPTSELRAPILLESRGCKGSYVALSHVWGRSKFLCTTSANIHSLQQEIPVYELSRTFQDAFQITRRLGFRYLWIDSLCILQKLGPDDAKSLKDWEFESSVMGDVYENAALVLAAAGSTDGSFGMLNRCELPATDLANPCRIRLQHGRDSVNDPVLYRRSQNSEDINFCLNDGPLAQRGWTLQEQLLAARILYYGRKQVYWKCQQSCCSADNMPCPRFLQLQDSKLPQLLRIREPASRASDADTKEAAYQEWNRVVNDGQKRQLTIEKDKLPALAGIASRIQTLTHSEFLAGIWRDDWRRGILWRIGVQHNTNTLPSEWRAPSWSWAKMEGEFVVRDLLGTEYITSPHNALLLAASIKLAGVNVFGEVRQGSSITIRGLTMTLLIDQQRFNESNGCIAGAWVDPKLGNCGGRRSLKCGNTVLDRNTFFMEEWPGCDARYTLLRVGSYLHTVSYDYEKKEARVHCLLMSAVDVTANKFEREGVVVFDEDSFSLQDWTLSNVVLV
jgi:hypothetical protein